ncbi:MAG TPA: OmpA family protein [Myxococcaceae bacterium]|nr:OmpA family protein [Myxococcaceae bacterium]
MRNAVAVLLLSSTACVTQGTYHQLKADHERTLSSLNQRERELQDARAALEEEQAKADRLSEEMALLQAALGDTRKDKSSLEAALADLRKRKAETEARIAEFRSLIDKFKGLIDAGKLKVRISEGRMVVELATDILFPSGSAALSKDGESSITEVAKLLQSIPDRKFQIEGHTDDVPIRGKYRSNWELASARSLTVLQAMLATGMPADRISAASYGDSKPARPNSSEENRAANRRIEIAVVPDLSTLPGFDELQRVAGH